MTSADCEETLNRCKMRKRTSERKDRRRNLLNVQDQPVLNGDNRGRIVVGAYWMFKIRQYWMNIIGVGRVRDHGWGPRMKTWRVLKYRVKTLTGSGTKWSTLNPMVSNYKISKDLKRYKKDLKGTCDLRREFKKQFELFMAAVRHQMTDGQTDGQTPN